MNHYKIAACVGGTLFVLFTIGSCSTPEFKWCQPGWNTLGYGCDAWLQSLSQLFGGLATLVAVVWTINFGRGRDREQMTASLTALTFEVWAAERHFEFCRNRTNEVATMVAAAPEAIQSKMAEGHMRMLAGGKPLPIYESSGSALAILSKWTASRVINAVANIETWPSYLGATLMHNAPQNLLKDVAARADQISRSCREARTALETELHIDIEADRNKAP